MKEEIKCDSGGILTQIERKDYKSDYAKFTIEELQKAIDIVAKKTMIEQFPSFTFGNMLFHISCHFRIKYPDYNYTYIYHNRIEVYEFRFYKKYKQNVEFREYYNSKYEKINK